MSATAFPEGAAPKAPGQHSGIREAAPADVPAMVKLVYELADYERSVDECHLTDEQLHAALFAPAPALFGHVAELDGEVVGFALWFLNFSTWRGVHGIYLEDLYVRPAARGGGYGKALLAELARICQERGYARLDWSVLDRPELTPSRAFYRAIGAEPQPEWEPW